MRTKIVRQGGALICLSLLLFTYGCGKPVYYPLERKQFLSSGGEFQKCCKCGQDTTLFKMDKKSNKICFNCFMKTK